MATVIIYARGFQEGDHNGVSPRHCETADFIFNSTKPREVERTRATGFHTGRAGYLKSVTSHGISAREKADNGSATGIVRTPHNGKVNRAKSQRATGNIETVPPAWGNNVGGPVKP